jgi:hypothetical protein
VAALAEPGAFTNTCSSVLTRIVDTVPTSVQLSDVITSYELEAINMQLKVAADKKSL